MKAFKELEKEFNEKRAFEKAKIKVQSNKWKRFWMWVWYLICFPFKWIFTNIRDWRTAVIFVIVFLVVSSEVWIPYLIGLIFWGNETIRVTMFSVGSACWLFWLGPFTPFMVICIGLTIAVKALFNKIKDRREKRCQNKKINDGN